MGIRNLRTLTFFLILLSLLPLSDDAILGENDSDFDNFTYSDEEFDPGSCRPIFEPNTRPESDPSPLYYSGVMKMVNSASRGDERLMAEAEIEAAAGKGCGHAGFLTGMGMGRGRNKAASFLCRSFAAENGNMQSKIALAYIYSRQDMHDEALKPYAELAEDSPVMEPIRIHNGAEENKEALRKCR